jgi:hypothetical protein
MPIEQSSFLNKESGSYIWHLDNYYIEFNRKKDKTDTLYYTDAFIRYVSNSAKDEIISISDSIRKTLKPHDMLHIGLKYPSWKETNKYYYDKEFTLKITDIHRKDIEEPRAITDVKYHIVFKDRFNDEICKYENLKLNLTNPVKPHNGLYDSNNNDFTFTYKYNSNSSKFKDLDRLQNLKSSEYKILADIVSIILDDGTVIDEY